MYYAIFEMELSGAVAVILSAIAYVAGGLYPASRPVSTWLRRAPYALIAGGIGLMVLGCLMYGLLHLSALEIFGWGLVAIGSICLLIGATTLLILAFGVPDDATLRVRNRRAGIYFLSVGVLVLALGSILAATT